MAVSVLNLYTRKTLYELYNTFIRILLYAMNDSLGYLFVIYIDIYIKHMCLICISGIWFNYTLYNIYIKYKYMRICECIYITKLNVS